MTSQLVLKGAIDGRKENQYLLAERYYYGLSEEKNIPLAKSWYFEAAKRGHTASIYMYAYLLLSGEGGEVNVKKGTKYLIKAVKILSKNCIFLLTISTQRAIISELCFGGARHVLTYMAA